MLLNAYFHAMVWGRYSSYSDRRARSTGYLILFNGQSTTESKVDVQCLLYIIVIHDGDDDDDSDDDDG